MKKRYLKLVVAGVVLVAMLLSGIEGYRHHRCRIFIKAHDGIAIIRPTHIYVGDVKIWTIEKISVEHDHSY